MKIVTPGDDVRSQTPRDLAAALRSLMCVEGVSGLELLTGGASRQTWRFTTSADGVIKPYVLQLQVEGEHSSRTNDVETQADVMTAARAAGTPVPSVVRAANSSAPLGGPYLIMEHVEGEVIARRILRDERFAAARTRFGADCGSALASLHCVDVHGLALVTVDPLEFCRDGLDQLGEPQPALEFGLRWLERNRPDATGTAVVHGDFRLGNLLIDTSGLRAVLDWEIAHVGDPMADVGWLSAKTWRFGGVRPVGGVAEYEELFAPYTEKTGRTVDTATLVWWQALSSLRWGLMSLQQAGRHVRGETRSHELAAIGRRASAAMWDLLELLP